MRVVADFDADSKVDLALKFTDLVFQKNRLLETAYIRSISINVSEEVYKFIDKVYKEEYIPHMKGMKCQDLGYGDTYVLHEVFFVLDIIAFSESKFVIELWMNDHLNSTKSI